LATSALGLTLMSACGSFGTSSGTSSGTSVKNQSSTGGQAAALSLTAKKVGNLGSVVIDRQGMTLYRFDKDTSNPPTSTCEGPCADTWPPFTTTETQIHLEGVDKTLVGTIARKDGSVQLTLGGWPLYRYAKDAAPGDAKGQGVGSTWFAATPQGKKATATVDAPTDPAPADNGGSGY
jgi:predicted lipoprotein with Yx(FWY)xxD motif